MCPSFACTAFFTGNVYDGQLAQMIIAYNGMKRPVIFVPITDPDPANQETTPSLVPPAVATKANQVSGEATVSELLSTFS